MAARTSAGLTRSARMSLRPPSLVSPTTAFTLRTSSFPGQASTSATTPSMAAPTASVLVSTIGVSIVPSSCTCVAPASLPKALPTNTPAATLSRNTLPPCGTMAVTPVRIRSPSTSVRWPTRTPETSVMASSRPGGNTPGAMPMSRARGLASAAGSAERKAGAPSAPASAARAAIDKARREVPITGRAGGDGQP